MDDEDDDDEGTTFTPEELERMRTPEGAADLYAELKLAQDAQTRRCLDLLDMARDSMDEESWEALLADPTNPRGSSCAGSSNSSGECSSSGDTSRATDIVTTSGHAPETPPQNRPDDGAGRRLHRGADQGPDAPPSRPAPASAWQARRAQVTMTHFSFRFRFRLSGEVIESEVIIAAPAEWARSPESEDPRWSVWRGEHRVIANSLAIPTTLLRDGLDDPRLPGAGCA
jgi:hypothetical protein